MNARHFQNSGKSLLARGLETEETTWIKVALVTGYYRQQPQVRGLAGRIGADGLGGLVVALVS